jgi:hypothetical protein
MYKTIFWNISMAIKTARNAAKVLKISDGFNNKKEGANSWLYIT